jgi:hypothetical protein
MKLKKIAVVLTLGFALSTGAHAGEVMGKITSGGASVGEGATVAAKCGDKQYPAVKTDKAGAYHLVVQETGKCTLTVGLKGQSATVEIVSYDDAAEADLVLEVKDGKLTARRK